MTINFAAQDKWLTDNVIIITHMLSAKPGHDIRVAHNIRDMRPLSCVLKGADLTR